MFKSYSVDANSSCDFARGHPVLDIMEGHSTLRRWLTSGQWRMWPTMQVFYVNEDLFSMTSQSDDSVQLWSKCDSARYC